MLSFIAIDSGDGPVVVYNRAESNAVARVMNRLNQSGQSYPETMEEIFKQFGTAYDRRVYRGYLSKQRMVAC